jgi:hypothetical protein
MIIIDEAMLTLQIAGADCLQRQIIRIVGKIFFYSQSDPG